jgi:hypothetical protein
LSKAALDPGSTGQASDASTDVVSSFNGQAKIHDGVLSTQRIALEMPGVGADEAADSVLQTEVP